MAKKPKFYPILPYDKRQKRKHTDPTAGSVPCLYRKYAYYEVTGKATGSTTKIVADDRSVNMGNSSKSKSNNPGWRLLIAKGGDATFPYSRELYSYKPIGYTCWSDSPVDRSTGFGTTHGGHLLLDMDNQVLKDQALAKLKNRLNGSIGNAQLAAPLAESREIHRLVKQVNGLTLDMLKAALAIKKTKGKSAAKFFGDVWLGFGFGVRPMIDDITKAANSILDYTTREDRHVRVAGTASREYTSGRRDAPFEIACYGLALGVNNAAHHRQSVHIVAGIDLKLRTAASYSVLDHLGLDWDGVPGAIWEYLPFTWVVDYVATVGPWVDDMFFTLPGSVKYVSQSEKYQNETINDPFGVPSFGYSGKISGTPGKANYVSFTRTKLATLPTRALRFKTVDEIAKHGLTKILNLGSVLAQKHGGPGLTKYRRTVGTRAQSGIIS